LMTVLSLCIRGAKEEAEEAAQEDAGVRAK
jgi:hypothetical protein